MIRDIAESPGAGEPVEFPYAADVVEARARIHAAHGNAASGREDLQESNRAAAAPVIRALVAERAAARGPVVAVKWTGREVGLDITVTDVSVEHRDGHTNLSLKSTSRGDGTLRNLGASALAELFGVDVAVVNPLMHEEVLTAWKATCSPERYDELAALPITQRRKHATDEERAIAGEVGVQAMRLVADALFDALNQQSQDDLRAAAAAALGIPPDPDPDLFVVVANPTGAKVKPAPAGVPAGMLRAVRKSPVRIVLECDGVSLFAWQVNCTNGKGLSALCLRSFSV